MLADRGELDFHAPVARYWPEFAGGGKERVEVRHVMGHTAGLSGWTEPLEAGGSRRLGEGDLAARREQTPWWEPGSASGYHAVTQGFLIGELVRRITGISIGSFFSSEIAAPLGRRLPDRAARRGRRTGLARHPATADRRQRSRSCRASWPAR